MAFREGGPTTITSSYFDSVTDGNVPGEQAVTFQGMNISTGVTQETVWDVGGNYRYLSGPTQLYVSSTNADDTVEITIACLDENYAQFTATATLNGQNQVAISVPNAFRIASFSNQSTTQLLGEVYLAEAGTLTAGVPNDPLLIQSKIPFSFPAETDPLFLLDNAAHNGFWTTPLGYSFKIYQISTETAKGQSGYISGRTRFYNETEMKPGVFLGVNPISFFETRKDFVFDRSLLYPEKTDLQFRSSGDSPGVFSSVQVQGILKKNAE